MVKEGASWDWLAVYDWNVIQKEISFIMEVCQLKKLSNKDRKYYSDLVWGITNTFKYKNFTLSFTLDVVSRFILL